jgi:hypothetical protein
MRILSGLALLILASNINARSAQEYLPADSDPDPTIPTPESVLGWEVGDWHVSHDQLLTYMQSLADASPRVSIKVIGHTYEQRPLLQMRISSPDNQAKLDTLRQEHLEGDGPLVVWLGYSVHGNEASGSNASLLAAYYLASSQSEFVSHLLEESVILIDPSINPDGLNRFASWANSNAGKVPVTDPLTRQHAENWPGGRTNHYWFDLNRDWLPLVHPESRARIVEFHRWLPHVLTDHHEQGGRVGFFFQPGVPSRQNPLTPLENLELTRALAVYHAIAMDESGQPFFTEDAYDDFYFGKGSTYPDINGSVGILFEQKAIRGQALETSNGIETFRTAVANQLNVSLSTLRGAWALRDRLKSYQEGFHDDMMARASKRKFKAWIVGDDGDPERAGAFLKTLEMHQIEYQPLGENIRTGGHEYTRGHAWVVPAGQRQFGLLEALMEQRTTFEDNTFYDVSAWTLPLAYNLPYATLSKFPARQETVEASNGLSPRKDARAWAVPWNQLDAAPLLQALLTAGARVRASTKPFSIQTDSGLRSFQPGTLIVQAGVQDPEKLPKAQDILMDGALSGLEIYSMENTMTVAGPDLGAESFKRVSPIKPLIVGGKGTSSYGVGEQWHLLDQRLKMPAPIVEIQHFGRADLREYTHLLMADGDYGALGKSQISSIEQWVKNGGILVTVNRSAGWAEKLCFEADKANCSPEEAEDAPEEPLASRAYSDFERDKSEQVIGGAIVSTNLDLSHPLAFGFERTELPLMRKGTTELTPSDNAYSTPVRYTRSPLMAGFIGEERLEAIRNQPAVIAEKEGNGLVVRFANTPLFRGFWRGSERLFINALYFGQVIESTDLPEIASQRRPETPRQ